MNFGSAGGGGGGGTGTPWDLLAKGIQDTIGMGVGGYAGLKKGEREQDQWKKLMQADLLQKRKGWMVGEKPGEVELAPDVMGSVLQGVVTGGQMAKNAAPATQMLAGAMNKGSGWEPKEYAPIPAQSSNVPLETYSYPYAPSYYTPYKKSV